MILFFLIPAPNDDVMMDCLEIVSNQIGKDWKKLAIILKLSTKETSKDGDPYDNMMQCFGDAGFTVSWKSLKAALLKLKKQDLIKHLIKETNLTDGT